MKRQAAVIEQLIHGSPYCVPAMVPSTQGSPPHKLVTVTFLGQQARGGADLGCRTTLRLSANSGSMIPASLYVLPPKASSPDTPVHALARAPPLPRLPGPALPASPLGWPTVEAVIPSSELPGRHLPISAHQLLTAAGPGLSPRLRDVPGVRCDAGYLPWLLGPASNMVWPGALMMIQCIPEGPVENGQKTWPG